MLEFPINLDRCPVCRGEIAKNKGSLCFCSSYATFWHKLDANTKEDCRHEIASFYTHRPPMGDEISTE